MNNTTLPIKMDFSLEGDNTITLPLDLAKEMIAAWRRDYPTGTVKEIIGPHLDDMRAAKTIEEAVVISKRWVIKRELLERSIHNNWSEKETDNTGFASYVDSFKSPEQVDADRIFSFQNHMG